MMAKNDDLAGNKTRVTLDLDEPFVRRLADLEQLTYTSRPNVIRHALQIYEFVAKASLQGYKFYSVDKNGKQEFLAFFSPHVAMLETEKASDEKEDPVLVS